MPISNDPALKARWIGDYPPEVAGTPVDSTPTDSIFADNPVFGIPDLPQKETPLDLPEPEQEPTP